MNIYEAIQNGDTVYLDDKEVIVVKVRAGKCKVRRRENGKVLESNWISVDILQVK